MNTTPFAKLTVSPRSSSHQSKEDAAPTPRKRSKRYRAPKAPASAIPRDKKTTLVTYSQWERLADEELSRLRTYKPADEGGPRPIVIDSRASEELKEARRRLIGLYDRTQAADGLKPKQCIERDRLRRLDRGEQFVGVFACSRDPPSPLATDYEDSPTMIAGNSLGLLELIEHDLNDASETDFDDGQLGALLTDCDLIDSAFRIDTKTAIDKESSLQSTLSQLGFQQDRRM